MSLETWIKEFVQPRNVREVKTDLQRLERDLGKWEGLRPSALKRHGMAVEGGSIVEIDGHAKYAISIDTCSLCHAHFPKNNPTGDCYGCPLYKVRGARCDHMAEDSPNPGIVPYAEFVVDHNPEPMIQLLRDALVWAARVRAKQITGDNLQDMTEELLTIKEFLQLEREHRKAKKWWAGRYTVLNDHSVRVTVSVKYHEFYGQILRVNDDPVNYGTGHTIDKVSELHKHLRDTINNAAPVEAECSTQE